MAPNIRIFLQLAVLCCVVTTSFGTISNFQKALSELQKEVQEIKQHSQEEIKSLMTEQKRSKEEIQSLRQKIKQLEKRQELFVTNGWFIDNYQHIIEFLHEKIKNADKWLISWLCSIDRSNFVIDSNTYNMFQDYHVYCNSTFCSHSDTNLLSVN